jgi:chaperonin GroEL
MPVLWRDEWWEDLALASGATIISPASGVNLRDIEEKHLGHFDAIKVGKEETFIDGIQDLTKHIRALKVQGDDASLIRAARLNTKTARYFVGGLSDSAIHFRILKCEDALNSTASALENGIVAGGGIALMHAGNDIPASNSLGRLILRPALFEPCEQIVKNAGQDWMKLFHDKDLTMTEGFDSKSGTMVDMFDSGIVDSADVVLSAVRSAIGVAAGLLTIGSVILLAKEESQPHPMMPPVMR